MHFLPVGAQNVTPAETWRGYYRLGSCLKWCYSGCPINVTLETDQCPGPILHSGDADLQLYRGFVSQLQCTTAECICSLDHWHTTLQAIYNCGRKYCKIQVGTPSHPDPDFSEMLDVVRGYCSEMGFTLKEWILDLGKAYGNPSATYCGSPCSR